MTSVYPETGSKVVIDCPNASYAIVNKISKKSLEVESGGGMVRDPADESATKVEPEGVGSSLRKRLEK